MKKGESTRFLKRKVFGSSQFQQIFSKSNSNLKATSHKKAYNTYFQRSMHAQHHVKAPRNAKIMALGSGKRGKNQTANLKGGLNI